MPLKKLKSKPSRVPKVSSAVIARFQKSIWQHYKARKRAFPWREPAHFADPYKILVSEIMLQQTQASRVVGKYLEFLKTFPTIEALSRATPKQVIIVWQGLGYNRRALALKKIADAFVGSGKKNILEWISGDKSLGGQGQGWQGIVEKLDSLPGIGHATASSIAAFAWNLPTVFVETNIRRVFIHHFFKGKSMVSDESILKLVERTLPSSRSAETLGLVGTLDPGGPRDWYYALMDHGAMLKVTIENPNRRSRGYQIQKPFKGSNREVRGAILSLLSAASDHCLSRPLLGRKLASRLSAQQMSVVDSNCRAL